MEARGSTAGTLVCVLRRCLFCSSTEIETHGAGRVITARCRSCDAHFTVEFDPPDAPDLRARIEQLDEDDDGGLPHIADPAVADDVLIHLSASNCAGHGGAGSAVPTGGDGDRRGTTGRKHQSTQTQVRGRLGHTVCRGCGAGEPSWCVPRHRQRRHSRRHGIVPPDSRR